MKLNLRKITVTLRYFLMGLVIGLVDLVPGVSGGTLAFTFGIWENLLNSIGQILSSLKMAGKLKFRFAFAQLRDIEWQLVMPVGIGVLSSLLLGASIIAELLETRPEELRGLFLGLVITSVYFSMRTIESLNWKGLLFLVCGAGVSFFVAGLPAASIEDPSLLLVFVAASISISATILPGVSGSFILLIFGLYETFIEAVRDRDFVVWGVFCAGAWVGTAMFTSIIRTLLRRYRQIVIFALTGLMIGGSRVLWPWLGTDRGLLLPDSFDGVSAVLVSLVVGLLLAVVLHRIVRK